MLIMSQTGLDVYELDEVYISREETSNGQCCLYCNEHLFAIYDSIEDAKIVLERLFNSRDNFKLPERELVKD